MDECFGKSFADAVRSCGAEAIPLRDVFPAGAEDEQWLLYVAQNAYIGLTKDKQIGTNRLLRQAVFLSRARLVVFAVGPAKGAELAGLARQIVPKALRSISPRSGPCLFKATRSGALSESPMKKREFRELRRSHRSRS